MLDIIDNRGLTTEEIILSLNKIEVKNILIRNGIILNYSDKLKDILFCGESKILDVRECDKIETLRAYDDIIFKKYSKLEDDYYVYYCIKLHNIAQYIPVNFGRFMEIFHYHGWEEALKSIADFYIEDNPIHDSDDESYDCSESCDDCKLRKLMAEEEKRIIGGFYEEDSGYDFEL